MLQNIVRVDKPWGYELLWAKTERYVGKILHVRKGERLSLQFHKIKDETMYVASGKMLLILEDENGAMQEHTLGPGQAAHIKTGRKHRVVAIEDTDICEVSTPELNDVVRLEDSYGRKS